MRFAQVTGVLHAEPTGYRIVVTLDTKSAVQTVRDELVTGSVATRWSRES